MKYRKHVSEPWFSLIRDGRKTVEGRLNKGDFAKMNVGDIVEWFTKGKDSTIKTRVMRTTPYDNFLEYLETEGVKKTLPVGYVKTPEEGVERVYRKYFSEEPEAEHKVLAIEIQRL